MKWGHYGQEEEHLKWDAFWYIGLNAGFGYSMLVSTAILTLQFFEKKKLGFKIVVAILCPITIACAVCIGFFIYIPYQIYNIVRIIVEPRKNDKDSQFVERKLAFEDLGKVFAVSVVKEVSV